MRVPTRTLFGYGALAFPLAACFLCLQVFVPTFYAASMGLSLTTVGVILMVARLSDLLTDPVVGYLSDRTPVWLGRRRIWVLAGLPLIGLSAWLLFRPPVDPGAVYLLVWTTVIYLAGTMVIVPMNAWGAELSPDYHQRSRVTGIRALFGLLGTLAVLVLPAALGHADMRDLTVALELNTILVLASLGVAAVAICLTVPDRSHVRLPKTSIVAGFSVLRGASPVRKLLVAFLLNSVASAIPATLFLFFVTHILGRPDRAGMLMVCYFAAAALSVPVWVWASKRFGKSASWRFAMVSACLAFAWTPLLGPGDDAIFLAIVLISGLAAGADLVLPAALQADLIDWDELNTGYRRAGIFYALLGTATKLAFALAVVVTFPTLELAGFRADGPNTDGALRALGLLYGALPILLKLAALVLMRGYPITASAHQEIRRSLTLRAAE